MHQKTIIAMTVAAGLAALATQPGRAQPAPQAPAAKPAEEVYKNITELKGTPADQLNAAMQFISTSLGVDCEFCHVQGKFEADDKRPKKTARDMMAMTAKINKDNHINITCYSCHRGAQRPVNVPPVLESDTPPTRPAAGPPPAGGTQVTADQIIEKYQAAVGGVDALKKINSRVMKGAIIVGGNESPIELFTKAPNKRISVSHMGGNESYTAFDGTAGWTGNANMQRDMSATDATSASLDAQFALPLRLKELFPQLRRGRVQQVNGAACETLSGRLNGIGVTLYFDQNTGLLARMVRTTPTPMGAMPVQIDYADYRDTDGVKTPFKWTLARPNGRFTIQIKELQNNVAIDDAKFAKPAK